MTEPITKTQDGALYVRVSTHAQDELSPDAQVRLLKDYAQKNNINISNANIFMDNGISGKKADKRPEFQRMISLAKSEERPFTVILVWKFSRFARNQEESIVYKSLLRKQCGVDVVSISEPLIEGPFGSLIERIIEWMDEYYSIRLSGEVSRGMTEKALRGGYQTSPCLGYRAVGNGKAFQVVPEEAKIVQYIYKQYLTYHQEPIAIARKLNEMGLSSKRGNPFETRTVSYILQNKFYIGTILWNDIEHPGIHETFISREDFDAAQEKMRAAYRPKRRRSVSSCRHWLSGLVKCGECGASLSFNASKNGSDFFQCWKYGKGMHPQSMSITESKLTEAVCTYLENLLQGQDFTFAYYPPKTEHSLELEQLNQELKHLDTREQRIRMAFENGVDTLEEYKVSKERLQKDRERFKKLIASYSPIQENIPTKSNFLDKIRPVYDILKSEDVDYETKGKFIRSVVEEIIYDKNHNTLIFKLYCHSMEENTN